MELDDPSTFPVQGIVHVFGEAINFRRPRESRILILLSEFGLPFGVPAGTIVHVLGATPTPEIIDPPVECTGDCGADGEVTVDEILLMISIALGEVSLTACSPGDSNGDETITVDEILAALTAALEGCDDGVIIVIPPPTPFVASLITSGLMVFA